MSRQRVEATANRYRGFFQRSLIKISQEEDLAQTTPLRHSSLDRESRGKDSDVGYDGQGQSVSHVWSLPLIPEAEFGEQGRMSDCTKIRRYVERDCPDLMSHIECLYPLLGESKH